MAHFAKIEGGKVVNVIVADSVDGFDGVWVQTSYNTVAGVHHNDDKTPSGQPALRKNYAAIGYIYDEALDAFYADRVGDPTVDFDPITCTWVCNTPPPAPEVPPT